jgi:hypothetical protein
MEQLERREPAQTLFATIIKGQELLNKARGGDPITRCVMKLQQDVRTTQSLTHHDSHATLLGIKASRGLEGLIDRQEDQAGCWLWVEFPAQLTVGFPGRA